MQSIALAIAEQLGVREPQVAAAIALLDEGATVPFVARYRKEATGGLDDTQLRTLEERLGYLRELEERRGVILASIAEQDRLTPELEQAIRAADTKARLEDLYLPYRPKRRTKAQIAREAGLEPLADALLADPGLDPEAAAGAYVDAEKGVPGVKEALDGARQILMERFAEDAELVGTLREFLWEQGRITARVAEGKAESGAKFSDYFDHAEPIRSVPSHRALALFRGREEGVLLLGLVLAEEPEGTAPGPCEQKIARRFGIVDQGRPGDAWLGDTVRSTWRIKLSVQIQADLMARLKTLADDEAIRVFAGNLRDLLLAAPAGTRPTLGLDPGFRTGVKVAVVDATAKVRETAVIYPHEPQKRWDEAIAVLAALAVRHEVELVAIGNGTASRETDRLAAELLRRHPELKLTKVMVSEAGASVYSASAVAAEELPGMDVTLRGAVSIARRLQDPLAELVKIDPKSIGVGQYQHDLAPARLEHSLNAVVEDCVNAVGVDVNTASVPLLARVSGLGEALARAIVAHRHENGAFRRRQALFDVPRLGPKAFQLSAGFLRIMNGDDPLDASAVHPEAYPVVNKILTRTGRDIGSLIGDTATLRALTPDEFTDDEFGVPTVADILGELEKPGRDPRPAFRTATFRDGVEKLEHLTPGMVLEGVVTNVANFGAFVDIGVHQDGLVHVSALSEKFVKDPRSVVKPGDVVTVKVLDIDLKRRRIALTLRLSDQPGVAPVRTQNAGPQAGRTQAGRSQSGRTQGAKPPPKAAGPHSGDDTAGPKPAAEAGPKPAADKAPGKRTPRPAGASHKAPAPSGAMAEAFARARQQQTKR